MLNITEDRQTNLVVEIKVLEHGSSLPIPYYSTCGSSGADISAANSEDILLPAGKNVIIPSGFCLAIPPGYEGQIRSRSGLASKHQVVVLNSPGTLDSDYRGEIMVILANLSSEDFVVQRGMRIAQLVISPCVQAKFSLVDHLSATQRAAGGFGSTGI